MRTIRGHFKGIKMEALSNTKRLALILSKQACIEGMVAENSVRSFDGMALAYTYENFMEVADELENLANTPDDQL